MSTQSNKQNGGNETLTHSLRRAYYNIFIQLDNEKFATLEKASLKAAALV